MWRDYHRIRTSEAFRESWCNFLTGQVGVAAVPAFYQTVTDKLFKHMVLSQPSADEPQLTPVQPVTCEDTNIVRYAAGYVCRTVYSKKAVAAGSTGTWKLSSSMTLDNARLNEDGRREGL